MTAHRLCRVTQMPDDLGAVTVTAAPLIPVGELGRLAGTAEHSPPGARGSHLWLTSGEPQRRGNELDSTGGRER